MAKVVPTPKKSLEKIDVIDPRISSADTPSSLPPESPYFKNLLPNLNEEQAINLSNFCLDRFKQDKDSLSNREAMYANWLRLNACSPLQEKKSEPWEGASNVLMPVMTIACTQFWARSIDALMPSRDVVKGVPINENSQIDIERAIRVGKHMSYQVQYKMPHFAEGMEISMMNLPMSGSIFRKTYFDPIRKVNVSEYVAPDKFVINYFTRYIDDSPCYTQIFEESYNDMVIKQNAKLYSSVDELMDLSSVGEAATEPNDNSGVTEQRDKISGANKPQQDLYSMREMLEMHIIAPIFDENGKSIFGEKGGVARRFVVTIDKASRKIVRIIDPRYLDEETKIMTEVKWFTRYGFLPSPDGSIYGLGFGILLGATTEAVNTILNQLIDAGTLANTQSGFINKRSGVARGQLKMRRGEFTEVNVGPDGLQNAIMPLTFKEPSGVLFQLLTLLQDYANRVTTVSEISTGEMPRSDTSASAFNTAVEQGLKVFSAIYRGLHRSFSEELRKMFILNGIYLDEDEYFAVVGDKDAVAQSGEPPKTLKVFIAREDYKGSRDVIPASDPNAVSKMEKIQKSQVVYTTMLQNPLVMNSPSALLAVTEQYLTSLEENGVEVKKILGPIQEQLAIQMQQQKLMQQQMQLQEMEQNQKMQALGAFQRQIEEGHVPHEVLQGALNDMGAAQQMGAPGAQAQPQ